jgi:nucleoside-diphosphate-sugar epimerase
MRISLTGASGFVARSLKNYFDSNYTFIEFIRNNHYGIYDEDVILHFAGKAHDLKSVSDPSDYYKSNTDLTKVVFNAFLASNAKVFITLSSVKAVADTVKGELIEDVIPNPITHYGKSKLLAEQYILSKPIPEGKRVYILRPCMIHGPGNKGNLNLLYNIVSKGLPWPLGLFGNSRSFLSIENLCFIIKELIEREDILSGVYNVADDVPLSTNDLINLISESIGRKAKFLNINRSIILALARFGDFFKLPLDSERLEKLTQSYIVSNNKIKSALGKPLPLSSRDGLIRTFQSLSFNDQNI